jgi:hypothetical protein
LSVDDVDNQREKLNEPIGQKLPLSASVRITRAASLPKRARPPAAGQTLNAMSSTAAPVYGNAAGVVITLTVFAVWSFLHHRAVWLGAMGLALALCFKPHVAGLVWLYFLIANATQRKRAFAVLALTCALGLVSAIWMSQRAPHWFQERASIEQLLFARGGPDDPGPTFASAHSIGQVICLQVLLSFIRDNPVFYDPAAFIIIGILLVLWAFKTRRMKQPGRGVVWIALAAIAFLTMLPVYHRAYDARLVLLAIPACAQMWAQRRPARVWAVAVTALAILCTGDLFWIVVIGLLPQFHLPVAGSTGISIVIRSFPAPASLLIGGGFLSLGLLAYSLH